VIQTVKDVKLTIIIRSWLQFSHDYLTLSSTKS